MITCTLNSVDLTFETHPALFSPQHIDTGTLAMLSCVSFQENDKVLDLGCGYGVVGILAAKLIGADKVVMVDDDERAVTYAQKNAERNQVPGIAVYRSDGLKDIDDAGFTLILSNPPYHADFSVAKAFIEKGFNRLALHGRMVMVTKRDTWYRNRLAAIFGGVRVAQVEGYFVFTAEKRSMSYANKEKTPKTPPAKHKKKGAYKV